MDIDDRASYLEQRGLHLGWNRGLVKCQICHDRYHSSEYETCYDCRPPWLRFDRKEFTDDQKFDIMERDDFKCSSCGTRDEYLHVDHIKPCAIGGEADLWNGQVLCAKCNIRKGSNWLGTEWRQRRIELMHFYLTFGWPWLSYAEQNLLTDEATGKRDVVGYQPISGWFTSDWLEQESKKRKFIIESQRPRPLGLGEHGPVPEYVSLSGVAEVRRAVNFGTEFLWHTHVREALGMPSSEIPEWAIQKADVR